MINQKLPSIYYGGDYNPDQWNEDVWQEDMRLFKLAGVNVVTLPVFSWAKLEPKEGTYDFVWLDKVLNLAFENGIYVCLATSTAAQPAWMSLKYPEVLPVDFEGRKRNHGGRVNFCVNNKKYREMSGKLTRKLAERYKDHPGLLLWHVSNEYGNYCYCDTCAEEFREWLKKRYGTIEEVNKRWNMSFWGHTLYSFEEVTVPSGISEMWRGGGRERTNFQGLSIDYNRFMSDSILGCYLNEYNIIKKITPKVQVTTNLMGTFKPLDYFKWAEHMDVISWDSYPNPSDPMSSVALRHDLMRGLKNGQPFMLMEQTPSQQNWQAYNSLKRPGVMRSLSYQAVAHGADTILFFQLRRSIGACEKYHGALISHAGHENTRVFKECAQLGDELKVLGDKLIDSRLKARVAIIFDWDNWWAVELSSGPSISLNYVDQIEKYYSAFYAMNVAVDLVRCDSDFSKYDIVVAPVLYMVKPGVTKNIESFVENGGTFITTFFSGIVNENDLVTLGGYPGELRKMLGVWVEEIDALLLGTTNSMFIGETIGNLNKEYSCGMICELINLEGAKPIATYGKDFYTGKAALTVNQYGRGKAYYIATDPEESFALDFIKYVCEENHIKSPIEVEVGVEVTQRFKDDSEFTVIINFNDSDTKIDLKENQYIDLLTNSKKNGQIILKSKDLVILCKM